MAFFEDFLQSVLPSIREWLTLLEIENEVLAQDKVESRKTIEKLAGDLAELTKKLPESAIAKVDREWRDHNEESANALIGHLPKLGSFLMHGTRFC